MKYNDYPCLFQSSDKASLSTQKTFINMTRLDFILLVAAAIFSCLISSSSVGGYKWFAWAVVISLILSLILKLIIQVFRWDRKWFDTRAVAESVKTATWRYITGSEPYTLNLKQTEVDEKFIDELREILQARPEVQKCLSTHLEGEKQISERMREIRHMDFDKRKDIYIKQRVINQKKWYANKAKYNGKASILWFWVVIAVEILAILAAIYILNISRIILNPIGVFTTVAVVFSAWIQIKKHRELSQSYALGAQELAAVESLQNKIVDNNSFSQYVVSAEDAISKEHTLWCAKRD